MRAAPAGNCQFPAALKHDVPEQSNAETSGAAQMLSERTSRCSPFFTDRGSAIVNRNNIILFPARPRASAQALRTDPRRLLGLALGAAVRAGDKTTFRVLAQAAVTIDLDRAAKESPR